MNTGIQDAANLAWKLDLILGGAEDNILDTYHQERFPIGRRVLFQSGAMMRAITVKPWPARWLRNRLVPALLGIRPVHDAITGSFAGVTLRYPRRPHEHPLVGSRATGFLLIREKDRIPIDTTVRQARRTGDGPALLVRPDGYIAWAGSTTPTSRSPS